jgi:hypothetical protein
MDDIPKTCWAGQACSLLWDCPHLRTQACTNLHIIYRSHEKMFAAFFIPYIMLKRVGAGINWKFISSKGTCKGTPQASMLGSKSLEEPGATRYWIFYCSICLVQEGSWTRYTLGVPGKPSKGTCKGTPQASMLGSKSLEEPGATRYWIFY